MRLSLDQFAPQPYTDLALRLLIDTTRRGRLLTEPEVRSRLPRDARPLGAVHVVLAHGLVWGLVEHPAEGVYRLRDTPLPTATGPRIPVLGRIVPRERRTRQAQYAFWHLYSDGNWWVLNPLHEHRHDTAQAGLRAVRGWASRTGYLVDAVIPTPEVPGSVWLLRLRKEPRLPWYDGADATMRADRSRMSDTFGS